jgi:plastocyanin
MTRLACTLLLATVVATGCGGSDDDRPSGRTVAATPGSELRMTAEEYRFDPQVIRVKGPGKLTIDLANDGSLAHDVRVRRDGQDVGGTPSFQGGESRTATLDLKPGRYELLCTVGDHADLGMRGELVVK